MPIDLLIYMMIAAVLIFWLRNTLGTRHGEERDRATDLEQHLKNKATSEDALNQIKDLIDIDEKEQKIDMDVQNKSLEDDVRLLMKKDPSFNPKQFADGAKEAFAMIVEAFAKGDLRTLKDLLSPGVYQAFESAIEDRNVKGEKIETEIHAVSKAELLDISFLDKMVFIKMRFIADETCVIRDREGNILSGNPDRVTTMNDVWTFGKEIKSKNPTWFLFETADDVEEDHKTPVPDAASK